MATLENMPAEQEQNKQGFGQRLWDLLTEPADFIVDRAERRQARTLSALLLIFTLLACIREFVGLMSGSYLKESHSFLVFTTLILLLLVSYGLSRTKKYTWGAGLAIVSTILTIFMTVILLGEYTETSIFIVFMWLIPALILGSAFFSWRIMLVVSTITLALILVTSFLLPEIEIGDVTIAFSLIFVISVLLIILNRFRDQLEADRQLELNFTNRQLEQTRELLEGRAQALQLATEISRGFSQITDLRELLQASVETIRSRFNLYYVQIYLLNAETNMLVLQVGTGNTGQELVRQTHQLPLGSSSINGLAAAEKRVVVVPDTAAHPLFKPNALLPRTRSEMAAPLTIGSRVMGVLDLQSETLNGLSPENLPAFEALAGQLTVAIENAKLISEAAESQAVIESYTRRVTREGWSDYFEPVERQQFLGYTFSEAGLTPLTSPLPRELESQKVAQVSIDVIGEPIGTIQMETDEARNWTADELDLMASVATQVGQQVEMLRSLDQASYYREEAERTLRRMMHESWLDYEQSPTLADGFVYDQNSIQPATAVSPSHDAAAPMIRQDLSLHGEAIGELALTRPEEIDEQFAGELVTAVATQLVAHMENLRLAEQTEKALAQSQQLSHELASINQVVISVSNATGLQESMQIIVDELVAATNVDQARIALLDNERTKITIIAEKYKTTINKSVLGLEIPLAGNRLTQDVINIRQPIVVENCQTSPVTANIRDMLAEQQIQSMAVLPIIIDNVVIGTVGIDILDKQKAITDNQIKLAETLILQAATAIQKVRLFEQTQARAEELAVINDVAQAVSQQTDRTILINTVQAQIQRIIPVDAFFIALYDWQTNLLEYPYIFDDGQVFRSAPEPLPTHSIVYQVLQTGEAMLTQRTQSEIDELYETKAKKETRLGDLERVSASLLYIPLFTGQNTSGVLSVQSYQLNAYKESDLSLLSSIASHVAVALENARLLAETRQTAEREQILRSISTTINTSIDAESVLQTAAREIGRTLGLETYVYLTPTMGDRVKRASTPPVEMKQNGDGLEIE